MTMFFIKAILMSALPFYRVDFPIDPFPIDFIYVEYSHGKELGRQAIKEKGDAYTALRKLILNEKEGWRYDLTTYAPDHTFVSPKMKINCLGNVLVINYEDANNGWIQISKGNIKGLCPSVTLDNKPSNPIQ